MSPKFWESAPPPTHIWDRCPKKKQLFFYFFQFPYALLLAKFAMMPGLDGGGGWGQPNFSKASILGTLVLQPLPKYYALFRMVFYLLLDFVIAASFFILQTDKFETSQ